MRPRGYDPSRSSRYFDPRTGRYLPFDDFLRIADAIAKQRDRAEKYYDRARERIAEGVPQARASYWRRRLSSTRADLAEQNAFWREIDEQLTRETPAERKRRQKQERERDAFEREARRREAEEKERKRREEPKAVEHELSLDYDAKKGAARGSEVDITIRFWRQDKEPITMRDAWQAVNAYRATGEFPSNFEVAGIDWHGIAAKRKGRPKTSMAGPSAQVDTALSDFFAIIHSVRRDDLNLERLPVRLGSVKQDG